MKTFREFLDEEFNNKIEKHQILSHDLKESIIKILDESEPDVVDAFGYFIYLEYIEPDESINIDEIYFTLDDVKNLIDDICSYFGEDEDNFLNSAYSILNNIQNDDLSEYDDYEDDYDIDDEPNDMIDYVDENFYSLNEKPSQAVKIKNLKKGKHFLGQTALKTRQLQVHRAKSRRDAKARNKRRLYYKKYANVLKKQNKSRALAYKKGKGTKAIRRK